jgi:sulfur-oxidizing protein SoxY
MTRASQRRIATDRADAARRALLARGGALAALAGCGLLTGREVLAASADRAFEATTLAEVMRLIGGAPPASTAIELTTPDLVENGAVVPVTVTSRLAGTQEICIVAEFNPNPLIVRFTIPPGTEPFIATRVKMAQSCSVYAVVRAEGKLYAAVRDTKVIVGGCGG